MHTILPMIHEVFAQKRTSSVTAAPTSCLSASDFGSTAAAGAAAAVAAAAVVD